MKYYRSTNPILSRYQQQMVYQNKDICNAISGRRHTIHVKVLDKSAPSVKRVAKILFDADHKGNVPAPRFKFVEDSVRVRYLYMALAVLGIRQRSGFCS